MKTKSFKCLLLVWRRYNRNKRSSLPEESEEEEEEEDDGVLTRLTRNTDAR
jgi:hypothetical protein